jgi:hypothetical protein
MESEGAGFGASQSVRSKISFHMLFLVFLHSTDHFSFFQMAIKEVSER